MSAATEATLKPQVVEYDPITGVPSEFNDYLPKDCDEYKRWVSAKEGGLEGQVAGLSVSDTPTDDVEKRLPGGKVKKKSKPEVVLEVSTRSKKKSVTTIVGLELFSVKLPEAAKLFGKKFASGASITKSPTDKDQVEVQGDFLDKAAELIVKTYADRGVVKKRIFVIDNKKKVPYFDVDEETND